MSTAQNNSGGGSKDGIDLRLAVEILSNRPSCSHATAVVGNETHRDGTETSSDGCAHGHNSEGHQQRHHHHHHDRRQHREETKGDPSPYRGMGQTINLFDDDDDDDKEDERRRGDSVRTAASGQSRSEDDGGSSATATSTAESERQQHRRQQQQEREERLKQIRDELGTMSDVELLRELLRVQERRVETYRQYDRGLEETALRSPSSSASASAAVDASGYPYVCASATASFAVLSDTVNVIGRIVQERNDECHGLIRKLQQHESKKLNLTAALHLERIRQNGMDQQQQQRRQQQQTGDDGDGDGDGGRIANLLRQGVSSLRQQIQRCEEEINEVLDEVRCIMMDME